ncbi:TFIIB-type zinc ribbon-containing protein [Helcobacillus massiliensis]|uniref:TFIIB-type zinc ribbon-containing protein n=1 Tax=Helcobacillus massiliensis TaxID=521392 RepID=UPI00255212F8|nr:TFIIB-type zinc ribbon-containing protein [Helcobacillus massiliensis]MDK7743051.1 TFIIB-type zinc ribbon-containing protein [Helcobacillus massiliensis]WOO91964.1 TFIIB-type zinc ribbon-containing protein [Helcobacillus massiliensis]
MSAPFDPNAPRPIPQGAHDAHRVAADPQGAPLNGTEASDEAMTDIRPVGEQVIDTSRGQQSGFQKCPRCGSTEIGYSPVAAALVCTYCRFQWNEANADQQFGFDSSISSLRGTVRGSGAANLAEDDSVVTIRCAGCGADVVIDPQQAAQARCHWCRQVLSLGQRIGNGRIPDAILPFTVPHEAAVKNIREFAGSRRAFATAAFKEGFQPQNILGVYMPYMLVDATMDVELQGRGQEHLGTRTVGSDDKRRTYYIAQEYEFGRRFTLRVDDLPLESNADRAHMNTAVNTNNVINAVQPFDTKNAVAYNPNYLSGFTSERRDTNIADLGGEAADGFLSIARARASGMLPLYDRGVVWEREGLDVHGSRWVSIYLPVWLYSHMEHRSDGSQFVHYIAVNGRTGRTMGSVPVSQGKLIAVSALASLGGLVLGFLAPLVANAF